MSPERQADPFAATADAASYVPRRVSEDALEAAEWALRSGRRTVLVAGPAGIGKTTLLRVLARRLGNDFRSIYAPYAALPADELCAWLLGLLDEKSQGDPEDELLQFARSCAARCHGLVAMIDDAGSIPLATARRLATLATRAEGALRIVLVCGDEEPAERIYPALGAVIEEIRLEEPLCLDEAIHYVDRRLDRARAPESVRARFDPETVREIHRRSRGIPGVLSRLSAELVRGRTLEDMREPTAPVPSGLPDPAPAGEPTGAGAHAAGGEAPVALDPPVALDGEEEAAPTWAGDDEEEYDRSVPRELLRYHPRRRFLEEPPRTLLIVAASLLLAISAVVLPWLRPPVPAETAPAAEETLPAPRDATAPEPSARPAPAPPAPRAVERAAAPPTAAATPGFVSVNINATPWARIAVDGVHLGETPLAGIPLLVGEHTITATLPNGQIIERRVQVDADNRHFGFGP